VQPTAPVPTTTEPAALGLSTIYAPLTEPAAREEDQVMDTDDLDTRSLVSAEALSNALFSYTTNTTGDKGVIESMQQVYGLMDITDVFERVVGLYARPPLLSDRVGEVPEMDGMDIDGTIV